MALNMLDKTVRTSPAEGRGIKNSERHIVIRQCVRSVPQLICPSTVYVVRG